MRFRKSLAAVAVVATAAVALSGCSLKSSPAPAGAAAASSSNFALDYKPTKKSGFDIGYSVGFYGNAFMAQHMADVQAVGKELQKSGVVDKFDFVPTNGGPQAQIQAIQGMIDEGVDAIVVTPAQANTLSAVVAKAVAKGILVVDQSPESYPNIVSVGVNQLQWSEIQTKWLAAQLKGKGNLVRISGLAGNAADTIRLDEDDKILKEYPDIKMLASAPGGWDPTKAQQAMSSFLSTYHDIDAVYSHNVMQMGVLQAMKAADVAPKILTGDDTYEYLRAWKNDYPDMKSITVTSQPGDGADALKVAASILQGKKLKQSSLSENPIDPKLKNHVYVAPAYVVTKTVEQDAPWMKGMNPLTKQISLDQALALNPDAKSSQSLDAIMTDDQVAALFK